jgi:hypothetical protein
MRTTPIAEAARLPKLRITAATGAQSPRSSDDRAFHSLATASKLAPELFPHPAFGLSPLIVEMV